MDVYIGIAVGVLIIAIFGMLATSLLGIKERSYEEALAEQRGATNELLGLPSQSHQKSNKTKEKKMKKIVKKNKDKLNTEVKNIPPSTKVETTPTSQQKHHVEFKEVEIVSEEAELPKKKVQSKVDKIRPILVHRQEAETSDKLTVNKQAVGPTAKNPEPANHFEQIHPKDDLELLQTHLKEESKEIKPTKANKPSPSSQIEPNQKEGKKAAKQTAKIDVANANVAEKPTTVSAKSSPSAPQPVAVEEAVASTSNTNVTSTAAPSVVKEKKKKSNASGNKLLLQQNNGVASMASLFPLVRNAELSRSEVQNFIDMLLNKQLEAPSVLDEWSEGRADPVQKMKRQLLEREKQLESEQEAKVSLQQKLVKLREELNSERIQWIQRTKTLEESLQVQQQTALHHTKQIQQLQVQLNDAKKQCEDYMVLQRQLKQLETHAAQVAEVEEGRVNKLLADNQEKQAVIGQQRIELCNITEQLRHASEKFNTAAVDLAHKDSLIRELEQTRISMEHKHTASFNQMQSHLHQQNEEIRRYEFNNDEMQKQRSNTERLIAQLRSELAQTQDQSIHGALATNEAHQVEVRNLQNELSSLHGQLNTSVREHKRTVDEMQEELEKQKQKNNALRERNWKVVEALNVAESRSKKCANEEQNSTSSANEVHLCRKFAERLFPKLQLTSNPSTEDIMTEVQNSVQTLFDDLNRSQTTEVQLQNKVEYLQDAILDSDTMLKNVYTKIQQEEIDWRSKMNEKDAEINRLKEDAESSSNPSSTKDLSMPSLVPFDCSSSIFTDELQIQITELQLELSGEQDMHRKTQEQLEALQKQVESAGSIMQELQNLKSALKEDNILPPDESSAFMNNTSTAKILENSKTNCTSTNGPAPASDETNGK